MTGALPNQIGVLEYVIKGNSAPLDADIADAESKIRASMRRVDAERARQDRADAAAAGAKKNAVTRAATDAAQAEQSVTKATEQAIADRRRRYEIWWALQAARQDAAEKREADRLSRQEAREKASAARTAARTAKTYRNAQGLTRGQQNNLNFQNIAQAQDILVSLAGGQNPLMVLLQQGSQLVTVYGSAGAAIRGFGGFLMGMVNPATVAAAAVVLLGAAATAGADEIGEIRRALIETGNQSGVTAAQLYASSETVAQAAGVTRGAAVEALGAMVMAGVRGGDALTKGAVAAAQWAKATGESVEDVAKRFGDLQRAPTQAVLKLNESLNFLTSSTYLQIKALEESGNKTEAARIAQEAYAAAINNASPQILQNLSLWERAWNQVAGAVKSAWDAMKDIGRADPNAAHMRIAELAAEEAKLRESIATMQVAASFGSKTAEGAKNSELLASLKQQLADRENERKLLQVNLRLQQYQADEGKKRAQQTQDIVEWGKIEEKDLSKKKKLEEEILRIKTIGARLIGTKKEDGTLFTQKDIDAQVAAARQKITPPKTPEKFDKQAYLLGLKKNVGTELDEINAKQAAALQHLAELRGKAMRGEVTGGLTAADETEAKRIINQQYAEERVQLAIKTAQRINAEEERIRQDEEQKRKAERQTVSAGRDIAAGLGSLAPQAAQDAERMQIEARYQEQLATVDAARLLDLEHEKTYTDAKIALAQQREDALAAIEQNSQRQRLSQAEGIFADLASIMETAAGRQSGIFKVMFAAQKAFAIAQSIINIQTAMSSAAMSLPFPGNLAAIGTVISATASIVSTIASTNYGGARKYGGPTAGDSMYRINETGMPEILNMGGAQYLLPTGGQGSVTPASQVKSGTSINVIINNTISDSASVQASMIDDKTVSILISKATEAVAGQITSRTGPVGSAMKTAGYQGSLRGGV